MENSILQAEIEMRREVSLNDIDILYLSNNFTTELAKTCAIMQRNLCNGTYATEPVTQ
jgi:hypothetical protein